MSLLSHDLGQLRTYVSQSEQLPFVVHALKSSKDGGFFILMDQVHAELEDENKKGKERRRRESSSSKATVFATFHSP